MRVYLFLLTALAATISNAQSAIFFRNGREMEVIPLEIIKEPVVSDLRKEEQIPVEVIEVIEPIVFVKEQEILTPIADNLKKVEPIAVEVQQPLDIINEILPEAAEEIQSEVDDGLKVLPPLEQQEGVEPAAVAPAPAADSPSEVQPNSIRQGEIQPAVPTVTPTTTARPNNPIISLLQNNLITQLFNNLQNQTSGVQADGTTQNPNLLQQWQTNFQNTVTNLANVFNPNAVASNNAVVAEGAESAPQAVTASPPPNIVQQLTQNIQNAWQQVVGANGQQPPATPAPNNNPIQQALNNFQQFFTGNRDQQQQNAAVLPNAAPTQADAKPQRLELPVNDKVDDISSREDEEKEGEQNSEQFIKVGEEDSSDNDDDSSIKDEEMMSVAEKMKPDNLMSEDNMKTGGPKKE